MIKLTEKEYRKLDLISYSSLKDFINNRKRFYKKYILKEQVDEISEDDNDNLLLGSMVDGLLTLSDEEFNKKFVILNQDRERGQMADLGDEIWKITKKHIGEDGTLLIEFLDIFSMAFNNIKYDRNGNEVQFKGKKQDDVLLKFNESKEKKFYDERLKNINSISITMEDYNKALAIKDLLLSTEWTREIFDVHNSNSNSTVIFQMTVKHDIKNITLKSMFDVLHINHDKKIIQPYDLKVSYFINDFEYSYIKNKYYIQLGVYNNAVEHFKNNNPEYKDYIVKPLKFVVADSTNNFLPIIYSCTEKNIIDSYEGFTLFNGKTYKGINEIIDELSWCFENNIWNCPKDVYMQNGELEINY